MLRSISIIFLGVATLAATPLDAQLIRRFSPGVQQRQAYSASNYYQGNQQQQVQQANNAQLLAQRNAMQAYQTVRTGAGQSPANCTCSQNQQPQQNQVARQPVIQGSAPTPAVNQDIQAPQQQQQQRYAVYYNPRTNQTYLRPIQSVARTVQNSNLNPANLRANRQQAQAATPPYATPPVARTLQPQIQAAPVALNAPAPTPVAVPLVSPVITVPKIEPAMNAPVGTLTSQPSPAVAPTPAVAAPKSTEETSNKTFSILESSEAPTPAEIKVNEPGEIIQVDLNLPKSGDK